MGSPISGIARWYEQRVLPRFVERACNAPGIRRLRPKATAGLVGTVIEVGFGAGPNVEFYPPDVTRVLADVTRTLGGRTLALFAANRRRDLVAPKEPPHFTPDGKHRVGLGRQGRQIGIGVGLDSTTERSCSLGVHGDPPSEVNRESPYRATYSIDVIAGSRKRELSMDTNLSGVRNSRPQTPRTVVPSDRCESRCSDCW